MPRSKTSKPAAHAASADAATTSAAAESKPSKGGDSSIVAAVEAALSALPRDIEKLKREDVRDAMVKAVGATLSSKVCSLLVVRGCALWRSASCLLPCATHGVAPAHAASLTPPGY